MEDGITPRVRIQREDLFELVWSEPMRTIAPRLGVSDVGLRKICLRANLPLPPVGYWEKLRHGKRVHKRPPLPVLKSGIDRSIIIAASRHRTDKAEVSLPEDIASLIDTERAKPGQISIPKIVRPHPIVARWKVADQSRPNNIEKRRRRILSVLFHEIEKLNGRVSAVSHETFKLTLAGETTEIRVRELYVQVKVPLSADDRRWSWNENREWNTKTERSGILSLRLEDYFLGSIRKHWRDTPTSPLEDQLRSVLVGLLTASALARKHRIEAEERERERYRAEQERWAREEQRRRDQQ